MSGMARLSVRFEGVDIVFGNSPRKALPLIDEGMLREDIKEQTGQILGVAGCTLDVQEGEILVLMGLSGSGKSTLVRAVNGLNPVIRGKVQVNCSRPGEADNWVDPHSCSFAELRKLRLHSVSMVFQQFGLLPWRSVFENVGFGLELAGNSKANIAAMVKEQLQLVGLADWADKPVQELSGGMQQRVGLARAFATNAPILLMDEPYSALDPLIRARLQDELIDLQTRLKRTILFVSHDLDEAIKIGNRIAIMEGGRIVQVGTPAEILASPANGYVASFVSHMNPIHVLCARDVMTKLDNKMKEKPADDLQSIGPDHSLNEIMILIESHPSGTLLVKDEGGILGQITARDVNRALINRAVGQS